MKSTLNKYFSINEAITLIALFTTIIPNISFSDELPSKISGTISIAGVNHVETENKMKLIVNILDVSVADASSISIAGKEFITDGRKQLTFELPYDPRRIEKKNHYIVSAEVHVTRDDSFVKKYISMRSYPVLTRGYGNHVEITVNSIF